MQKKLSLKKIALILTMAVALAQVVHAEEWATPEKIPVSLPASSQMQGPIQVGDHMPVNLESTGIPYGPPADQETQLVWSEEITVPGASYIAPHFKQFHLPPHAQLIVRAPDGSRSWSYAGFGKTSNGQLMKDGFWGIHIPGDTAVLELFSGVPIPAQRVVVDDIAHGFPVQQGFGPENVTLESIRNKAICGADDSLWAQCYGGNIYIKSKAVARLLTNGTYACTGWLVGDEGHLITNEHCIGNAADAVNTDYEFMAEGACGTNCVSWFDCPGTVVDGGGTTLTRANVPLDYALVQLPTNVSATYGYLQMRASGAVDDERIYIPQHPLAGGKKIAVLSDFPASGNCEVYSTNEAPCSGGPGDIGYYCDTQPGSSGSPVLSYADNTVVALHHCADCPNRGVPIEEIIIDLGIDLPDSATESCIPTESYESSCSDDSDNDCDGLTDGADTDCTCTLTENPEVSCTDALDNDCDGLTDAADPDCRGNCPVGSIDFRSFTLVDYAAQTGGGTSSVLDNGDTLRLSDDIWLRSMQTFDVTADTVVEFDFASGSQGEIHAIALEENDALNDHGRHFQFWGTQNWTDNGKVLDWTPPYSGSGSYESFSIPVGQYYAGPEMTLVFANENDATSGNEGKFQCVRVHEKLCLPLGEPSPASPGNAKGRAKKSNTVSGTWKAPPEGVTVEAFDIYRKVGTCDDGVNQFLRIDQQVELEGPDPTVDDNIYTYPDATVSLSDNSYAYLVTSVTAGCSSAFSNCYDVSCEVVEDFEVDTGNWTTSGTCTTGSFVRGTPDSVVDGGVTTQIDGAQSGSSALFTVAGPTNVTGGECVVTSPIYFMVDASLLSLWYYHGQRDGGDDPGTDYFYVETSISGGAWTPIAYHGDGTVNAAWTNATATVAAGASVQIRVRVSDGATATDVIEAGIDNLLICDQ